MASESPNQKRKRGRPPNASKTDNTAPGSKAAARSAAQPSEQDLGDEARPRKRVKGLKAAPASTKVQTEEPATEAPRRRGRSSLNRMGDEAEAEAATSSRTAEEQPVAKKKRGRSSLGKDATTSKTNAGRDARTKQSREVPEGDEPLSRRRRRTSARASDTNVPTETPASSSRREKAPSRREVEPSQSSSNTSGKKRKSKRQSTEHTEQEPSSSTRARRKSGGRSSLPSQAHSQPSEDSTQRSTRKTAEPQQQDEEAAPRARKVPYRHLKPRVRHVPRSTIQERWSPLEPGAVAAVATLLRLAERPVLDRLSRNERRREQARAAVRAVSRRVAGKLSRGLPFPPALAGGPSAPAGQQQQQQQGAGAKGAKRTAREQELDFGGAAGAVRALEAQLDPLLHAVELLRAEKEAVEADLGRDYEVLEGLERNARGEGRVRRERLRKAHVLVPERTVQRNGDAVGGDDNLEGKGLRKGLLFKDIDNDELKDLTRQVGSHMESIRSNLQQVDGVVPQLVRSRAALQALLFRRLDRDRYEQAVLG